MRLALDRYKLFPFEVALAVFYMCSGTFGLLSGNLSTSSLSPVLGSDSLVAVFQAAHILGGLVVVIGVLSGRGNIHGAGVFLLAMNLIVRFVIVMSGLPISIGIVIGTLIPWAATIVACLARLHSLIYNETFFRVKMKQVTRIVEP